MATEAAAPPTDTPAWPTAPELDPKYDEELLGKYPTIVPKTGTPAEDEKGYAGNLNDMQKAQLFQLRSMLESEGYNDRLDTLTMVRAALLSISPSSRPLTMLLLAAVLACPQVRRQPVQADVSAVSHRHERAS